MAPTSLSVPFVQEIAKEGLSTVPERYVRPQNERSIPSTDTNTNLPQVPVIDMAKLLSHDLKAPELQKLHHACKHWGFFQLINHGVSSAVVENMKKSTKEFFNLPIEEKKRFGQRGGDIEGYGQLFVVCEEQKLDWADVFYLLTLPSTLRKPHLFPNLPHPFKDDLESYCAEMKKLAVEVLEHMAEAVGMEKKEMREIFGEGSQVMRMNYYPPCPQPELVTGLTPHSDGAALTILLQLNPVQGLQIRKDGQWVPVKPLPNAFVINMGDILEMVTNGIYQSVEHQATVNSEKERISVATFLIPSMESTIGPAPSLITPQTPPLFRTLTYGEFYNAYLSRELRGKEFLYSLKI